jgi:hypothetical protein
VEPIAEERVEPIAEERVEPIAEERVEPIAEELQHPEPQSPEVAGDDLAEKDPNESWWVEPQSKKSEAAAAAAADWQPEPETHRDSRFGQFWPVAATVEEPQPEPPQSDVEPGPEPAAYEPQEESVPMLETPSDLDAVEEDTEAFLEKVFSQLEDNEKPEQPEEEGHGLLRRRRFGSVLKEITEED